MTVQGDLVIHGASAFTLEKTNMNVDEALERILRVRQMKYPKFDVTLKKLFSPNNSILRSLLGAPRTGTALSEEFMGFAINRVDVLVRARGSLHHIEFQSENDDAMPWRMLSYYHRIVARHGSLKTPTPITVEQTVLYVGEDGLDMPCRLRGRDLDYRYKLRNITEFEASIPEMMESEILEDQILSVLCKATCDPRHWKKVAQSLLRLPKEEAENGLALLLVASLLRPLDIRTKLELEKMAVTINVRKSSVFQEVFTDGEIKGNLEEALRSALDNCEIAGFEITGHIVSSLGDLSLPQLQMLRREIFRYERGDFDDAVTYVMEHAPEW